MKVVKSQVIEFDSDAERNRIATFFPVAERTALLRVLDALESSDLKAASAAYTPDVASHLPSAVNSIIKGYRDHIRDPAVYGCPELRPDPGTTFTNPNDVRVQHAYALHVLSSHRYLLAKLVVALQNCESETPEAEELLKQALATLHGANGAKDLDVFRLTEADGKLSVSFD